ncbi:uncharacterized protein V1510DRAFT_424127 [Dipodascopsis tothii]|uniref:uncharacterized protein n=1 Tax=Dipodascopsis tothii TaxID=44089 RepID=UPI0034CEC6FD
MRSSNTIGSAITCKNFCLLPFTAALPQTFGPGTFSSTMAKVRYLVFLTADVKYGNKQERVRTVDELRFVPRGAAMPSPSTPADDWAMANKYIVENAGPLLFSPKGQLRVRIMTFGQVFRAGRTCTIGLKLTNETAHNVTKIKFRLVRRISVFGEHGRPDRTSEKVVLKDALSATVDRDYVKVVPQTTALLRKKLALPADVVSVDAAGFQVAYVVDVLVGGHLGQYLKTRFPITIAYSAAGPSLPPTTPQTLTRSALTPAGRGLPQFQASARSQRPRFTTRQRSNFSTIRTLKGRPNPYAHLRKKFKLDHRDRSRASADASSMRLNRSRRTLHLSAMHDPTADDYADLGLELENSRASRLAPRDGVLLVRNDSDDLFEHRAYDRDNVSIATYRKPSDQPLVSVREVLNSTTDDTNLIYVPYRRPSSKSHYINLKAAANSLEEDDQDVKCFV